MTVSVLRGEHGFQRKEIQKLTTWLRHAARPDIVTLPNSLLIGLARPIREALEPGQSGRQAATLSPPVCCTLQGEDLFLSQLPEPYRTTALGLIRANVDQVDAFTAVSDCYAGFMCRYLGIPQHKMHVVPLGINLDGYSARPQSGAGFFTVGYFARVTPEKGLHLLAESYVRLRRQTEFGASTLEVAGYLAPEHRAYLQGVKQRMAEEGLAQEFHYRGVLDRGQKLEFLRKLDVLSVPAVYDEPKGIFLLEAMASGVPVVQPRRGAFAEILERAGGGILVEPDDAASLAEGIFSLRKDPALRAELGRRGAEGVREHYSAARMAARALEVYRGIVQTTSEARSRPAGE